MTLHQIRRLWQKHVIAENRRDIPGLLATLCDDPTYIIIATNELKPPAPTAIIRQKTKRG